MQEAKTFVAGPAHDLLTNIITKHTRVYVEVVQDVVDGGHRRAHSQPRSLVSHLDLLGTASRTQGV
jgi:hypothetical protein